MTRKEEIIYATLELASEYGLKAVSLGQIAAKIGIKKPSLYNHFASKDEIVSEMYSELRKQAQRRNTVSGDYTSSFEYMQYIRHTFCHTFCIRKNLCLPLKKCSCLSMS